mmetsp:Transcript_24942/g.71995  ORF Transcript_24942/g.71995 Transcript_24942/m.71995 type:complete len:231 (+) Transcript_24942:597-1289(+)
MSMICFTDAPEGGGGGRSSRHALTTASATSSLPAPQATSRSPLSLICWSTFSSPHSLWNGVGIRDVTNRCRNSRPDAEGADAAVSALLVVLLLVPSGRIRVRGSATFCTASRASSADRTCGIAGHRASARAATRSSDQWRSSGSMPPPPPPSIKLWPSLCRMVITNCSRASIGSALQTGMPTTASTSSSRAARCSTGTWPSSRPAPASPTTTSAARRASSAAGILVMCRR